MATYDFGALADQQTLAFAPAQDTLWFGDPAWGAAAVALGQAGRDLWLSGPDKTIVLARTQAANLASAHFGFADGSHLLVGDDTPGTALDNAANLLTGTGQGDYLEGLGGNDTLDGGGGNDRLIGDRGNDRLDGGTGADLMLGGVGNDSYVVDDPGDTVLENPGDGLDTVQSWIDYTLAPEVERLALLGNGTLAGHGNTLDNRLTGNAGDNALWGGDGDDTLLGGSGSDTLYGEAGGDFLYGGSGNDTLYGGDGWNELHGGGGRDALYGGADSDLMDGGAGIDTMAGGDGNDLYKVDNPRDQIDEAPGGGDDMAVSTVPYTLPPNVEYLLLPGGDRPGTVPLQAEAAGSDTLIFNGHGLNLDLGAAIAEYGLVRLDAIDLGDAADNRLNLDRQAVLDLAPASGILRIDGAAGDTLHFSDGGWVEGGSVTLLGTAYHSFANGPAQVWVNADLL
ncbi:Hemolysin-type calcium-binding repeat-containing protein [Methylomagnum ishizawai]|uniref:Hemolysin-type calcium-binding repeat-containing protein n=1 Tax=Methylomagnum ishizawai TaxID=1760988 RepID=A0A1Y6D2Q2_9GAMM|nr:calcium-binding protein [Methylomagnum ishizawai]SMF94842.1 Hemolysin-type calcium-binding repeat-containing protein [Methylomagnum ishizawai]